MAKQIFNSRQDSEGGISSFQAFAVGLASRVGTGNIAGVAIALTLGGPGAIFWMWVVAALGMATALSPRWPRCRPLPTWPWH
jgi:alanine or glycine:cation symporter, AGCS family